jgi:dGTP triphosphohydrolase
MKNPLSVACAISLALIVSAFGVLVGVDGYAEDAKKEEPKKDSDAKDDGGYKFVAPLTVVMEVMDDIFYKMPDKIKGTGASKYKVLKREALFCAEVANLATYVKEHRKDKGWLDLSESLKSNALKMAEAAEKKDDAAMKALHSKMEEACESCHEKFRDV